MKTILNFNLILTIFINSVQNSNVNFKSWSLTMTSNILVCFTHMSNNNFTIPTIVVFVWIGTNFANLDLLIMTKMASILSHFKRHVTKSINTFSKGPDIIEKALQNPIIFYVRTSYFGTSHKCGHNVLHPLSFWANRKSYSKSLSWFFFPWSLAIGTSCIFCMTFMCNFPCGK